LSPRPKRNRTLEIECASVAFNNTHQQIPLPNDFDWQTGNRFDRIVKVLFDPESHQFRVNSVQVGEVGSLTIVLDDGYKLEVFPPCIFLGRGCESFRSS
jgi:hypothetical protein